MVIAPGESDILVIVDVQNDFCPGGSLAVPDGGAIVPAINRLAEFFPHIIATQDWHPAGHRSFASAHPGKKPFETAELSHGVQILWPDHCVQGTHGAELHPALSISRCELILRKGFRENIDSYSAFFENDRLTVTGLDGYLRARRFKRIFIAGLATDFCVSYSAIDACRLGFGVLIIEDACRGIDLNGSVAAAWAEMEKAGGRRISSADIAACAR